jgi:lysophospholipase L1-like esterase
VRLGVPARAGARNDLYSDVTAGRTAAKIQADLAVMYAAARRHGAAVVAITVAPWGGFKRYFNARRGAATLEVNRWITEQRGATVDHVVDAHGLLACAADGPTHLCKPYARKDGLHLSAEGHGRLGEALHRQVFADRE